MESIPKPIIIFFSSSTSNLEEERGCLKDFEEIWNEYKHPDKPIKILKWENRNHFRPTGMSFQDGLNLDICESDLIIFLFSHVLGKHTKEEYDFAVNNKKSYYILVKEPQIDSFHKQPIKWFNDFIKLRKFLNNVNNHGILTGVTPIANLSDFQWQLSNCIENYISHLLMDKASSKANDLFNRGKSPDMIILETIQQSLRDFPGKN